MTYGKLAFVDGVWTISEIPPHVAIKLKSLFPKIPKTQVGVFEFKDTGEICADLDWFMNRYPLEMSADDARRALLAAVSGARLVVGVRPDLPSLDGFLDDLRRIGRVHRIAIPEAQPATR